MLLKCISNQNERSKHNKQNKIATKYNANKYNIEKNI